MGLIDTFFNSDVLAASFPILLRGLWNTLRLSVTAILCGSVLGVLACLMRLYALRPFRLLAVLYIDLLRAIPALVLLTLVYYALPFLGINLTAFTSASLALSLVLSAFTAEVVRAGVEAVPQGQFEAASALGLHFWRAMHTVVLPQALRVVIPPQTSNIVSIIKDTSLASVVTMPDLLKQATDAEALNANPTPLIGAALLYVAILWPLVRLVAWLEARARRGRIR